MTRAVAIARKELLEYRRTPALFVPVAIVALVSVALPLFLAIGVPVLAGEPLSGSDDFRRGVAAAAQVSPGLAGLPAEAAVQAFLFQQFLFFLMLIPISGAMSLAAYSIVGEKQARSLEPLLATPISTVELLAGKVAGAMLPSLAVMLAAGLLYVGAVAVLAEPGVARFLLSFRTMVIFLGLGPLAAVAALELAIVASSRASDPRSAQQVGILIILPVVALFLTQISGGLLLPTRWLVALGGGLLAVDVALLALAVRVFDRETILTRWR